MEKLLNFEEFLVYLGYEHSHGKLFVPFESEIMNFVRVFDTALNSQWGVVAKVMNLDKDCSFREIVCNADNAEIRKELNGYFQCMEVWRMMNKLISLALHYPSLIGLLGQGNLRRLILAFIISGPENDHINLLLQAILFRKQNNELFHECIAELSCYGITNESFCCWILENWDVCKAYKSKIVSSFKKTPKNDTIAYLVYLKSTSFWQRIINF